MSHWMIQAYPCDREELLQLLLAASKLSIDSNALLSLGGPGFLLLLIFKREFLKSELHGNEMLKKKYSDYTIKNLQCI